ncbi:hypothetical protein AS149_25880 [Burkholderia cenocepacia]|nr:hypothetical protein AS149_25880 [Burkholderia cenocepacia]
MSAHLDPSGCPVVDVTTDYKWTSHPRFEIAGGVWVDVDDAGNKALRGALDDAKKKVQDAAACDRFKKLVSQYWKAYTLPVEVPGQAQQAIISVLPTTLGVGGTHVDNASLVLGLYAQAQTAISLGSAPVVKAGPANVVALESMPLPALPPPAAKPIVPAAVNPANPLVPVPPPGTLPLPKSSLNVVVPVFLGYKDLLALAKSYAVGKSYPFSVGGKEGSVDVLDVDIYPSNDSVAVGLKMKAKIPGKLFDTSGWVYLVGKPVISPDGKKLQLTNLQFARQLDSSFWNAATYTFQDVIRQKVQQAATVDLEAEEAKASKALLDAVNSRATGDGYAIHMSPPVVKLNKVLVADSLVLEPQLNADFTVAADLKKLYAAAAK